MEEEQKNKIGLPETILMVMIVGSADLFELAATPVQIVPVVGQIFLFIKPFVSISVWVIVKFWLIMKGIRGLWFLAGGLSDTVANFFAVDIPFGKTAAVILTIYLANHPKATKVAQVATGKIGSIAKPGVTGETK